MLCFRPWRRKFAKGPVGLRIRPPPWRHRTPVSFCLPRLSGKDAFHRVPNLGLGFTPTHDTHVHSRAFMFTHVIHVIHVNQVTQVTEVTAWPFA